MPRRGVASIVEDRSRPVKYIVVPVANIISWHRQMVPPNEHSLLLTHLGVDLRHKHSMVEANMGASPQHRLVQILF